MAETLRNILVDWRGGTGAVGTVMLSIFILYVTLLLFVRRPGRVDRVHLGAISSASKNTLHNATVCDSCVCTVQYCTVRQLCDWEAATRGGTTRGRTTRDGTTRDGPAQLASTLVWCVRPKRAPLRERDQAVPALCNEGSATKACRRIWKSPFGHITCIHRFDALRPARCDTRQPQINRHRTVSSCPLPYLLSTLTNKNRGG